LNNNKLIKKLIRAFCWFYSFFIIENAMVQKTKHTFYIQYFFFENSAFCETMQKKKYCTAGQATGENMAQAHPMLDT